MNALNIVKRIASYIVFISAATLFLLNSVTVALAPYIDSVKAYDNSFLPFMYATLSLGVLLLFQLLVIGKPNEIEENIYPWLLLILFASMFFVSILVVGKAIAAGNTDPAKDPIYAIVGMITPLILSAVEIVIGAILLIKSKKSLAKTVQNEENGVNLTKEE